VEAVGVGEAVEVNLVFQDAGRVTQTRTRPRVDINLASDMIAVLTTLAVEHAPGVDRL
jgi:hypothetical protein